jgi:hypothetical protein
VVTETSEADFKGVRQETIVSVEENKVVPVALTDAGVACCGKPAVLLAHTSHPGITISDLSSVISRAIVDDDDFSEGIGEDARSPL